MVISSVIADRGEFWWNERKPDEPVVQIVAGCVVRSVRRSGLSLWVLSGLNFALPGDFRVFEPIAGEVELEDHAVMDEAVDGRCGGHLVLEDLLPLPHHGRDRPGAERIEDRRDPVQEWVRADATSSAETTRSI